MRRGLEKGLVVSGLLGAKRGLGRYFQDLEYGYVVDACLSRFAFSSS